MFNYLLSAAFVLLALTSVAQHRLSGVVRDAQNQRALAGATVMITENKLGTVTDAFGYYEFTNLPSGKYTVKVTFVGFGEKTEAVDVSSNVQLNVALDEIAILTDEVVVNATRANEKTPTTFSSIDKEQLQKQNFGQDLPFLLNWTPSVVTTSDAGTGVGYTGVRIRGSDATRVNVTINGIPYNDSESMGTFWVNIPDIASSTQSVQIQRGVGTSTNGAGAFGATVNLQTNKRNDVAYAEVINAYGSFNTRRHSLNFGTGLLNDKWVIDGRLSRIASDGFIDRAFADLKSYYLAGGYYGTNTMFKFITFGGSERTYQAWYGVPESRLNNDVEAMETTAINEGWNDQQLQNLLTSDSRTFNPYTYKNQVDDYRQDHYQFHFSQNLSTDVNLNAALHYTPGRGFYEEFRYDNDFEDYGLAPVTIGDSLIESTDLIRRRWLDNDFYGFTYALNVDKSNWNLVVGGGWNRYDGDHFGEIIWAKVSTVPQGHRYYFNVGDKRDFNAYSKLNFDFSERFNGFVDLQVRTIDYTAAGLDNRMNDFNIDEQYTFFNPKVGLTYSVNDRNQLYASYAIANREPVRDDFVDNPGKTPEHETMGNLEAGWRTSGEGHRLQVNYYLMNYKNQLVLTGEINDVGASVRTNVDKSYRMGVEVDGLVKLSRKLTWNANVTLSQNKIASFTEVLYDYGANFDEYNVVENTYENTDISFSPSVIAGSALSYSPFRNFEASLLSKFVGKQYMDNTSNENRQIDSYFINDLRFAYAWRPAFVREINFSLLVNNILDEVYESNGYTWGYLAGPTAYRENYYFPQAGTNWMGMISIKI
ncbi:MAG TPA: TonB-dependent receptor [Chryseosolibacter sp.]